MAVDEFHYHRGRGLPAWERIGHPLDTLTLLACALWASEIAYTPKRLPVYLGLAVFSCLFVTKDEWVHKQVCSAGEQWLHALLFVLHPCVLFVWGFAWASSQATGLMRAQAILIFLFMIYQTLYWSLSWKPPKPLQPTDR